MLERHRELGSHRGVAGVTEIGLRFREQVFSTLRFVNRVAARADDILFSVDAALDIRARYGLSVAAEAGVEGFLRPDLSESNDGRLAPASIDVRLSAAMAALASRVFRLLSSRCQALVMRILVEIRPDIRVTRLANGAADIIRGKRARGTQGRSKQDNTKQLH